MTRAITVFILLEHWGEYDYTGVRVIGAYKDIDAVNVKKARLEMAHMVDGLGDDCVETVFYEIEETQAIIQAAQRLNKLPGR